LLTDKQTNNDDYITFLAEVTTQLLQRLTFPLESLCRLQNGQSTSEKTSQKVSLTAVIVTVVTYYNARSSW